MISFLLYIATVIVLALFDLVWIGWLARSFYSSQLGSLLSLHPIWWDIALFYLLYAAALIYFVIDPALAAHSLRRAILGGLFFGLVAYGTYDLTNLATTANWPVLVTIVDMVWGTLAGGAVSALVYLFAVGVLGM